MRTASLISIVIPSYNEEGNVELIHQEIIKTIGGESPLQLIFVNDGSSDQTENRIQKLAETHKEVEFISFSRNFGHQAALKAGIDNAKGDCVISMDADLQHPPALLPEMLAYWKEGYDVVYTQRKQDKGISIFKKITSKLFYQIMRRLSGIPIEEGTADFRLLDRKVTKVIKDSPDKYIFIRGLVPWVGFKQKKMEYVPQQRHSGVTKYTLRRMSNFAVNGITSFSTKPLQLATLLGMVISILSFAYALYAIAFYFFDDRVISGWASLLTSVLFIGGIQLIILGIIGEYIGKIYMQLKNRPLYIIKSSSLNHSEE